MREIEGTKAVALLDHLMAVPVISCPNFEHGRLFLEAIHISFHPL